LNFDIFIFENTRDTFLGDAKILELQLFTLFLVFVRSVEIALQHLAQRKECKTTFPTTVHSCNVTHVIQWTTIWPNQSIWYIKDVENNNVIEKMETCNHDGLVS